MTRVAAQGTGMAQLYSALCGLVSIAARSWAVRCTISSVDVVESAEVRLALLKEVTTVVAQLKVNESERVALTAKRQVACKELRAIGLSIGELQQVLGLSRSRVQQVLRGVRL